MTDFLVKDSIFDLKKELRLPGSGLQAKSNGCEEAYPGWHYLTLIINPHADCEPN